MWNYIAESSLWSLAGLVVGYSLGRVERQINEINRKMDEESHDDA